MLEKKTTHSSPDPLKSIELLKKRARIVYRHVKMSKPPIIFQIPDSTFLKKKILLK